MEHKPHKGFDVYLSGKLIDTVFFGDPETPEEVRKSLIEHDDYDPNITVKPESE